MNQILLIGGTDPSGAGLQTDLKVAHHLNTPASSIVTAVTAQNASAVFDQGILSAEHVKAQLNSLNNQHFSAIKIGMLGNEQVIDAVIQFLRSLKIDEKPPVILDPVLSSSSQGQLLSDAGRQTLLSELLPYVDLITPNTDELQQLTQIKIDDDGTHLNQQAIESSGQSLLNKGAKAVLIKGGHLSDNTNSTDFYIDTSQQFYLRGQRWENKKNVRGTGCALATSIACALNNQFSLSDAVVFAKAFISNGIRHSINVDDQLQLHFDQVGIQNPFDLADYPKLYKDVSTLHLAISNKQSSFAPCETKRLGIYPVVDSFEWIKKLVELGITTIQLRIKDQKDEDVEDEIKKTIDFAKKQNIRLFINDYWRLAIKHKAYGIHLGQEDLDEADMQAIAESGCRLGVSTHSYTEIARAYGINPSYLALGPIFATTSKDMPWIPQGVTAVSNWVKLLGSDYPLVAIGGIDYQRASDLKNTNVDSVAMISAITQADDYKQATNELIELWRE